MMTRERFEQVAADGAWADLSGRAKWRVSGGDRVRYVNGQVTNDVRRATGGQAVYAMVTDAKGRIVGDVFIREAPDGQALLLDAEAGLREVLGARLERYIVADDVEIEDVTEGWCLWHRFGSAAEEGVDDAKGGMAGEAGFCARASRFGVEGMDVWVPTGEDGQRPDTAAPVLDDGEVEALRILRGIPRWPAELGEGTFPPEAGLEERAMDFAKGCYIGQEILSRMRTTGKYPRKLVRWEAADAEVMVVAGEQMFGQGEGGTWHAAGRITSATVDPVSMKRTGLGFVKQGTVSAHSGLLVGADMPRIEARVNISQFSR